MRVRLRKKIAEVATEILGGQGLSPGGLRQTLDEATREVVNAWQEETAEPPQS